MKVVAVFLELCVIHLRIVVSQLSHQIGTPGRIVVMIVPKEVGGTVTVFLGNHLPRARALADVITGGQSVFQTDPVCLVFQGTRITIADGAFNHVGDIHSRAPAEAGAYDGAYLQGSQRLLVVLVFVPLMLLDGVSHLVRQDKGQLRLVFQNVEDTRIHNDDAIRER